MRPPLLALAAATAAGAALGGWLGGAPALWLAAGAGCLLAGMAAGKLRLLVAVAWLCLAAADASHFQAVLPGTMAGALGQEVTLRGRVLAPPEVRTSSPGDSPYASWVFDTVQRQVGNLWVPAAGRIRVSDYGPSPFPQPGQEVRLRGLLKRPRGARNPWELNYRTYLAERGIAYQLSLTQAGHRRVLAEGRPFLPERVAWWLAARMKAVYACLPRDQAALLAALVLGDTAGVSGRLMDDFVASGLVHVLAVSGSNVALMAGLVGAVGGRLPLTAGWRAVLTALFVLLFVLMTGATASVMRAGLAALVGVWAGYRDRASNGWNALALAATLLLLLRPASLWDIGFQLSFAATFGILAWYRPFLRRFTRLGRTGEALALTLAAQVPVIPVALWHFGRLSLIAPLANVVAVPVAAVLVVAGFGLGLAGALAPALACWVMPLVGWGVAGLGALVHAFARVPYAQIWLPRPGLLGLGLYALGVGWVLGWPWRPHWLPRPWTRRLVHAFVLLFCAVALGQAAGRLDRRLTITFIDVGQGDGIVLRLPDGRTMFVDGGNLDLPGLEDGTVGGDGQAPTTSRFAVRDIPRGEGAAVGYLRWAGVHRVDYLVLTHPHADHINGLLPLAAQFPVGVIIDSDPPPTPALLRLRQEVARRGGVHQIVRAGERFVLAGVRFEVLGPPGPGHYQGTHSDLNNDSVVLRLVFGRFRALLAGDAEAEAESDMVKSGQSLESDVLKIGHHGSAFSSTSAFLAKVRAQIGIVSLGRNDYGMPAPSALRRWQQAGLQIWRTDLEGAIFLATDGRKVQLRSQARPTWQTVLP